LSDPAGSDLYTPAKELRHLGKFQPDSFTTEKRLLEKFQPDSFQDFWESFSPIALMTFGKVSAR